MRRSFWINSIESGQQPLFSAVFTTWCYHKHFNGFAILKTLSALCVFKWLHYGKLHEANYIFPSSWLQVSHIYLIMFSRKLLIKSGSWQENINAYCMLCSCFCVDGVHPHAIYYTVHGNKDTNWQRMMMIVWHTTKLEWHVVLWHVNCVPLGCQWCQQKIA